MQINKLKCLKDGRIEIKWTEFVGETGEEKDETDKKFTEPPQESFEEALINLRAHACALCEFPMEDAKKIKVVGMEIHRKGDHEVVGAILFLTRDLLKSNTNLNIPTPLKFVDKPGDGPDKGDVFTKEAAAAVKKMVREVESYISGERLQTDAFDTNTEDCPVNKDLAADENVPDEEESE